MEKDCCVVVTHLHQEEMVVDPNNYDVSELREQATADDTSNNEGDDHGFNWVTDQENDQENDQEYDQENDQEYDDSDNETDAFLPKDQWQFPVDKERQSERESQRSDQEPQGSDQKQQQSQESFQFSTQGNDNPDDHGSSKFFTSQDGGRILPRQRTDENDTRRTTTPGSYDRTEEAEPITDNDPNERRGKGERGEERREKRKAQGRKKRGVEGRRERGVKGKEKREAEQESRRQRLERLGVDPINYDLGKLRTVTDQDSDGPELDTEAHGFVWSEPPEQYRTRIEDPTAEQHQRLLTIAGIDPELVGEKPYLTRVPTEAAGSFVIDWLEFLTGEAGTKGAIDALARYQEIGWFTARVENELRNSMRRIDDRDGDGFSVFDRGDHLLSFAYVAKIAAINSEGMMFY